MSDVKHRCKYCGVAYGYDEHDNEKCLSNPHNKTCITCKYYDLDYEKTHLYEPDKGSKIMRICEKTDPPRTIDQRTHDEIFERREGLVGWVCKEWEPIEKCEYTVWIEKWKK